MNPWPFIIIAYALAALTVGGLTAWSWVAMRSAEAEADKLGRDREA